MGILGLKTFLENSNLMGVEIISLQQLANKTVSVDLSNLLHMFKRRTSVQDSNENAFLCEMINFIHKFTKYGISLIFVFDGKPCTQKYKIINKRRKIRERAKLELEQMIPSIDSISIYDELSSSPDEKEFNMNSILNTPENREYTKRKNILIKKSQGIKTSDIYKCKNLFDNLLIPYIHVKNMEADSVFKYLQNYKLADYCYTNDTDAFAYGCNMLLDLNYSTDFIKLYDYQKILNELDLLPMQMLEICICCGNDYTSGLKYITCSELIELYHKYSCLNDIMENNAINISAFPYDFNYDLSFDIFNSDFPPELCNNISNFKYIRCYLEYVEIDSVQVINNIQSITDNVLDQCNDLKQKIKYQRKLIDYVKIRFSIFLNS